MELPRTPRLLAALLLMAASQPLARAQDGSTAAAVTDDKSAPASGDGVRPVDPAEPVVPKERPRLKDNEVVSLKRRLEVHGGMSFTYGWASGGRNFREAGAWVSYFDPESGLGLAFGLSRLSGDVPYDYGYYPYSPGYVRDGWFHTGPRTGYDVDLFWVRPGFSVDVGFSQTDFTGRPAFDGTGSSLRRHF